jgi:sulfur relay (sulfurtransferase) complex TusBCD TusD component (DsrE family)
MHLGIVVTTDAGEPHAIGLAQAALQKGWACRCFLTDRGVLLLNSPRFLALARAGQLRVDVCEHSWEQYGATEPPAGVAMGSQYQNAELAHQCDRVIVL